MLIVRAHVGLEVKERQQRVADLNQHIAKHKGTVHPNTQLFLPSGSSVIRRDQLWDCSAMFTLVDATSNIKSGKYELPRLKNEANTFNFALRKTRLHNSFGLCG